MTIGFWVANISVAMNDRPDRSPRHSPPLPESETSQLILDELLAFVVGRQRAMAQNWCRRAVSMTHLQVLMLLEGESYLSMSQLAEALDVALPSATGIVDRMEERGLVERRRDEQDRRVVQVRLTEVGRAAVDEGDVIRRQHLERVVSEMTPRQGADCLRTIRALKEIFGRLKREGKLESAAEAPHVTRRAS